MPGSPVEEDAARHMTKVFYEQRFCLPSSPLRLTLKMEPDPGGLAKTSPFLFLPASGFHGSQDPGHPCGVRPLFANSAAALTSVQREIDQEPFGDVRPGH
jgi:hypothetical protein